MHFDILGRSLQTTPLPGAVHDLLQTAWAYPEHVLPAVGYVIDVQYTSPDPLAWQEGAWHTVQTSGGNFPVRLTPAGFYFEDNSGQLSCRHLAHQTSIELHLTDEQTLSPYLEGALYVAMQEALECSGLLAFHGAAASLNGAACAFLGPSGMGKSTTLLRAAQAGWTPVAEDTFWLDPTSTLIYGWERHVRLLPDTQALLAVETGQNWLVSSDGKVNVPYDALPGQGVQRGGVPLRTLAVLSRQPEPAGWYAMTRQQAALALWEALGLPLCQQARQLVAQQIGELLARLPYLRLNLGLKLGADQLPLHTWSEITP